MAELAPQPSVNDARGKAFAAVIARLGALDLTPLLVYRIDSVPDSALSFLAWQFDVLSPFWALLLPGSGVPAIDFNGPINYETIPDVGLIFDVKSLFNIAPGPLVEAIGSTPGLAALANSLRRQLLKQAVALHSKRGTPWAIKTAIAALGWPSATILEGQSAWGGSAYPSNQGWAVNRILINLADGESVPANAAAPIAAAFKFFAPARSWLDSVWFVAPGLADTLDPAPRDSGLGGMVGNFIAFDVLAPQVSDGGFSLTWPQGLADGLARVPIADGSYLAAGGLVGDGAAVGPVDDGFTLGGVAEGVGP